MERINPFEVSRKIREEAAAEKKEETANRNAIDSVSNCPVPGCKKPMKLLLANGIECNVCLDHKIALPKMND